MGQRPQGRHLPSVSSVDSVDLQRPAAVREPGKCVQSLARAPSTIMTKWGRSRMQASLPSQEAGVGADLKAAEDPQDGESGRVPPRLKEGSWGPDRQRGECQHRARQVG